jgi:hypothetical protein
MVNIPAASQPLKGPMSDGLLVSVTTVIDEQGDPVITLWVVATTNRQAAIAIVREANPHALSVDISERPVQPGTVKRLRLRPGEARML